MSSGKVDIRLNAEDRRRARELRRGENVLKHCQLLLDRDLGGRELETVKVPMEDRIPGRQCPQTGVWFGFGARVATCPFCEEEYSIDETTDDIYHCEHYDRDDGEFATFIGPKEDL